MQMLNSVLIGVNAIVAISAFQRGDIFLTMFAIIAMLFCSIAVISRSIVDRKK